jgi:ABC-type multidrug transport system fused ATPase/permease subunit
MLVASRRTSILEVVSRCLRTLPRKDQIRLAVVSALQVALAFLDLLGVAIIGLIGALSVTGVQSKSPSDSVSIALELLKLETLSFQSQVMVLASVASALLVARTFLSVYFIRRIFYFLSIKGAQISTDLITNFLGKNYAFVKKFQPQEALYGLTAGVQSITVGVLGNSVSMLADLSLLFLLLVGLLVVDPVIAASTLGIFGSLGAFLYWRLNARAQRLGARYSSLSVEGNKQFLETLSLFREISVGNHQDYYVRRINRTRIDLAGTTAEMQFLPFISKYVIESGIVLGAIAVAGIQFAILDATQAIATLAIFMASATRIAPSILRLQQSGISLRSNVGSAEMTFNLINELDSVKTNIDQNLLGSPQGTDQFVPMIELNAVSHVYSESGLGVSEIDLQIGVGEHVAIVGPSGAGKSTLVELILGLSEPTNGTISISGVSPRVAITRWPGSISYIPQEVAIVDLSLAENVALGIRRNEIDQVLLSRAINIAQLTEFVSGLRDGVDTPLGDFGGRISGGQRQRIGIARALYEEPKLIVMDEATSALDGQTESEVAKALSSVGTGVTVVTIAHRLSTVRNADRIIYMDSGRIRASGSFEEVRMKVPDFDRQAQLMGL